MWLEDFYDYKNRLMEDILTSEEIVSLVNDEVPFSESVSLAYTQVFPYEFVPETAQDGRTYICFDVDIQSVDYKTYYNPVLYVWVFSHKSRLRLPDGGGVRTDKLCSEICKVVNGSRLYGLGEVDLYSVRRFAPMTDYQGKCITFRMKEFNRQHDGKKPIPSNRKND